MKIRDLFKTILSYYYCLVDPNTPSKYKKIIIGSLIYFVFPVDLIPDFLGVVGYSDDLVVIIMAILSVRKFYKEEHKEKADKFLKNKKKKDKKKDK